MPSVATAPTATAAQTSAAGSRMLGYYLGGGGVKVDCLFDTANFLTKDATGDFIASAPVKAGASNTTTGVVGFALRYNNGYGAAIGALRSSGDITFSKYAKPSATVANGWESSVDTEAARSAIVLGNTEISFHFGGSTTTAIGGAVTLTKALGVTSTGVAFYNVPVLAINGSAAAPAISFINDPDTGIFMRASGVLCFATNGVQRAEFNTGGHFIPASDAIYPIGNSGARWSTVYAATGTINTSDAREKTWRGAPSFAELAAARRIAAELGFYQWNDAIAEKGEDGARYHFGVRAQAVWAIMADEGLIDPIVEGEAPNSRYAFLCHDAWDAVEAVAEERDEEGNITVEAVEAREAGDRFGIRPDQLALFLIAAQEARLAALEAA